jgi:ABC-type branched-subunit amino acid transport system substrate-binding protein
VKDGLGAKAGSMIVKEATYEVSDPTVDSQILTLKASGADTFINITTPKFGAQAVRKVYDSGWKPLHIINNVSASIGSVLTPAGLDKSMDVITVAYYKDADDPKWKDDPAMLQWRAFMAKYYRDGNVHDGSNIYAYIVAQTMEQVLRQCGNDLSRANIMKQAANLKNYKHPLLLPGIAINTSPTDFAPIDQAQLEKFNGKQYVLFGDVLGGGASQ